MYKLWEPSLTVGLPTSYVIAMVLILVSTIIIAFLANKWQLLREQNSISHIKEDSRKIAKQSNLEE